MIHADIFASQMQRLIQKKKEILMFNCTLRRMVDLQTILHITENKFSTGEKKYLRTHVFDRGTYLRRQISRRYADRTLKIVIQW